MATNSTIVSKLDCIINKIDDVISNNYPTRQSEKECISTHRVVIETDNIKNDIKHDSKQDEPRITELPNEMSWNIDISSPMEILRILRVCDSQIFNGWHEFANIYDFIPIINIIIRHLKDILSDTKNNKVILSGCGTSGRLAWLICRTFNKYLIENNYSPCFDYCLAGSDKALLTSQELPEDDPQNGVADLLACTKNAKNVLLIGITCGLSAPYVGGQIEYAMKQNNYVAVLMGFNPAHLSRNRAVEKWNGKTFRECAMKFDNISPRPVDFTDMDDEKHKHYNTLPKYILLNPIFGPETITGSSRMKSGSGTKILLDVIFIISCFEIHRNDNKNLSNKQLNEMICNLLHEYETIFRNAYSYQHLHELANICKMSGNSLQSKNGRVLYYGGPQAIALMSFIDASEMKPTYGTVLKRYRSYIKGGWAFLNNKEGDLSYIDERFKLEPKYLDISSLTSDDLIIVIGNVNPPILGQKCGCKIASMSVFMDDNKDETQVIEKYDYNGIVRMKNKALTNVREMISAHCHGLLTTFDDNCNMFAMKLLLNAVSTAGHVLCGTVLHNRMINVRVSNDKLFYRSIGMIQQFGKVSFDIGRKCLLLSIYGQEKYKEKEHEPVSTHLIAARDVDKIVPVAILLASQISQQIKVKKTINQIRDVLNNQPSVRKALIDFCK